MIAVSEFLHYSSPASTHNARDQLPTSANCDTCDKTDERALPMRELETSPFEKDRTCISGCRAAHSLHSFFRASLHSYLGLGALPVSPQENLHQGAWRSPLRHIWCIFALGLLVRLSSTSGLGTEEVVADIGPSPGRWACLCSDASRAPGSSRRGAGSSSPAWRACTESAAAGTKEAAAVSTEEAAAVGTEEADASGIGEAGTEEAAGTKEADADPRSLCFLAIWAFSLRSFVQSRFSFVS